MAIVSHYEIHRGRTSELERTDTGTATITMIDTTGALDPSGGSTDFDPMKPVAIALRNPVTGVSSTIFRGHVARWSYDMYPNEKYAIVTVDCVDGMDILAHTEITPSLVGATAAFGDAITSKQVGNIVYLEDDQVAHRINQVLNECGWPAGEREVFSGNVKLQEAVYAPRSPALTVITDAADAEFPGVANFLISRDGKAVFHGRLARFQPDSAQYHIAKWRAGDMANVAADSSRAVIFALDYDRDKDKIINSSLATPKGIADKDIETLTYEDPSSIAAYGTRSWSAENLLTKQDYLGASTSKDATQKFAWHYTDNYATPRTRVNRITFKTVPTSSTYAARVWAVMCGVDISDIIRLKTTHLAGGFDEDFFVEGIHYSVDPLNDQYLAVQLDLDVSPRSHYNIDNLS